MSVYSEPPTDPKDECLAIVRCPQNKDLKVVILSDRWIWLPTHYDGKRTVICNYDIDCRLCQSQVALWKGFAVVREFNGRRRALFVVTPNVVQSFREEFGLDANLSGVICRFYRAGRQVNSPLLVQFLGRSKTDVALCWKNTIKHVNRIFRSKCECFLIGNSESNEIPFVKSPPI